MISSPASTHYNLAKQAFLASKNVFVEKPLSLSVKEGEELVKIAKKKELILMVGHLLLFHPAITALKEEIEKGILEEINYIYSNRLNLGKIKK